MRKKKKSSHSSSRRTRVQFPEPKPGGSQPPAMPAPSDPMPSTYVTGRHIHKYTYQKKIFFKRPSAFGRLRLESCNFRPNLGYIARLWKETNSSEGIFRQRSVLPQAHILWEGMAEP